MSSQLSKDSCEACRLDAPVLSDKEISDLSTQIPSWIVYEEEGVKRLVCSFAFSSYKDSVNFTNKVGDLAESEDHHPDIHLSWGKVIVTIWSHEINGLHENDFIFAAKCDKLN